MTFESGRCSFCDGSGRCYRCHGQGYRVTRASRWAWLRRVAPCPVCGGFGDCQLCHGNDVPRPTHEAALASERS